jgi:phage-related protein
MDTMRKIIFYRTASGQNPIEDFLDQLPAKSAQKVTWVLKLIEDLEQVPSKYFKKLVNTQDLWEVRASAGSNIFRLIGFFDGHNIVVVTHGFQKKTQKTPKRAIKIAEERKKDYFRRKRT